MEVKLLKLVVVVFLVMVKRLVLRCWASRRRRTRELHGGADVRDPKRRERVCVCACAWEVVGATKKHEREEEKRGRILDAAVTRFSNRVQNGGGGRRPRVADPVVSLVRAAAARGQQSK